MLTTYSASPQLYEGVVVGEGHLFGIAAGQRGEHRDTGIYVLAFAGDDPPFR